jgi:hypothetical protein
MPDKPKFIEDVPVGRIFLALNNPRHQVFDTEEQVINRLCEKEDILPLARDIAKHGLNPLERFALVPSGRQKTGTPTNYYSAEGNRRLCALKLLSDPERAPAKLRKAFQKLSDTSAVPVKSVPAAVFKDEESVNLWLDRIHNGPQGGIGRKSWDSDQKQRFDGGSKNRPALSILDYAQNEGMINSEEREGKLTTVQRFIGNDIFREALGFEQTSPEEASRTRPKPEFDLMVKRFIADLIDKKHVNSRMNKDQIVRYARTLGSLPGTTNKRIDPEPLSTGSEDQKSPTGRRRKKPKKPEKARHVRYEEEIFSALKGYGNEKLMSLYHSICSVDLDPHTPLVSVGAWSFFETLTACAGRNDGTSFDSFLSKNKLQSYGIVDDMVSLRGAIERTRAYGNTTKHHPVAATFNGDQLNNDMIALKTVILKCIEEAAAKRK